MTIQETKNRSFILVKIVCSGTEELSKAVERYFLEYPEAGYQTLITDQGHEGDGYYALLTRLASCD